MGQFAILAHGLCWIHTERLVHKLIPMNDLQHAAVQHVRSQIWELYADLKAYRLQPDASRIAEVPLHTNGSETDIRDYVKKRKVSGGTRSDLGRTCRDTFASLKKTCRKLGVSFWDYLIDRVSLTHLIPPLRSSASAPALISGLRPDLLRSYNGS